MYEVYIEEIKLYKTKERFRKDYLIAKVRTPDETFYLGFVRGTTIIDGKPNDLVIPRGSSGKGRCNSELFRTLSFDVPSDSEMPPSSSVDSSLSSKPASSSLSSYPLPLYELAVLAHALHEMKTQQLLFSGKRYFYAGTIVKVLQELYKPTIKVETTGSKAINKKYGLQSRKSKWKQHEKEERTVCTCHESDIEVYAGEKINTAPIIEAFDEALEVFIKPVDDHERSHPQSRADASEAHLEALETHFFHMRQQFIHDQENMEAQEKRIFMYW